MAKSNRDKVGDALQALTDGLWPFISAEFKQKFGPGWEEQATENLRRQPNGNWDASATLNAMLDQWHTVFRDVLSAADRSLVFELRDVRNRWAHQEVFGSADTYRALDSMARLLRSASAGEAATEMERQAQDVMRLSFAEQGRAERRKSQRAAETAGDPKAGLAPWRDVVEPHEDVSGGNYLNAEFAADLHQVWKGEAAAEYVEPREFFRRTYLTQGLRGLLGNALKRLTKKGGDPVVALQTNFGGGKTHSMLALYHLFGETPAADLPGIDDLLSELQIGDVPHARRAVIVGEYMRPAEPRLMSDGTVTHTLWGDLAWQLAGADGYALVAADDRNGTNPGSALIDLFKLAGPSLILIDEWVGYARQLYEKHGLPAGSFDTQFTFAQALTQAASAVPGTLLVVSVPASDIEVGGTAGKEALTRLENVVARKEATWQPASTQEGFEIVRRRLFRPLDTDAYRKRDATVRAFMELYRDKTKEFPNEVAAADYEKRLTSAYPIHPDVFDRLYNEWSTLERFQKTRGVLRLMAAAIHVLWEREDRNLLILPGMLPMDEPKVREELTRYLDPAWRAVVEKDVDGADSTPLTIDRENNNLGRYSAARRVARTIFLGTAPLKGAANRGKDSRQVLLGSAQPGESLATFGDALRRLQNKATYLNTDGERSFYDTAQNINRDAESRKDGFSDDEVMDELVEALRQQEKQRGGFGRVHAAPMGSGDVPDSLETALVILSPEVTHSNNQGDSPAMAAATELLDHRGNGPRHYKNTLVFVAVDKSRLPGLLEAVRWWKAWRDIHDKRDELDLTQAQIRTAESKRKEWEDTVQQQVPEAFMWLLVPSQAKPADPVEIRASRLGGNAPLAVRAFEWLNREQLIVPKLGPTQLRRPLDQVPLWGGENKDHVAVRQLAEYFGRYLYLPRLASPRVLAESIADGVARLDWTTETFAYADAVEEDGRFAGLQAGQTVNITPDDPGVVVKAEAAIEQRRQAAEATTTADPAATTTPATPTPASGASGSTTLAPETASSATALPTRFYATVDLNPLRVGRDAGQFAQEVLAHLIGLSKASGEVTLEVNVVIPDGVSPEVQRIVSENCQTLKVRNFGLEDH